MNNEIIRKINKNLIKEDGTLMTFKEQIFDLMVGKFDFNHMMIIKDNSLALEFITKDKNKPLTINPNKILSIHNEHNLSYAKIADLEEMLKESPLAFDSLTQDTSKVIVLNEKDNYGDYIIAICRLDSINSHISVNQITSVYGKKNFEKFIERTFESNKNFYLNEKTEEFLQVEGLQLPNKMQESLSISNYRGVINQSQEVYKEDPASLVTFEYGDYTFINLHTFTAEENNIKFISNLYTHEDTLQMDYDGFYNNEKAKGDLFLCIERNEIYLPTDDGFKKILKDKVSYLDLDKKAQDILLEQKYLVKTGESLEAKLESNLVTKSPEVKRRRNGKGK